MAGRAMGYSDYYKSKRNIPENDDDTILPSRKGATPVPRSSNPTRTTPETADARKLAIKRRLMRKRAGK